MAKIRRLKKRNMYQIMVKCYDFIRNSYSECSLGNLDSIKDASYKFGGFDEWISFMFDEGCFFCRLDSLMAVDFYLRIICPSFSDGELFCMHFSLEKVLELMGWSKEYYYEKILV